MCCAMARPMPVPLMRADVAPSPRTNSAEDARLLARRDADAEVAHGDGDRALGQSGRVAAHGDVDLPRVARVLHGVVEQVPHRAAERLGVGLNEVIAGLHAAPDFEAAAVELGAELLNEVAHQGAGVERLERVGAAAGFHAAEVEERLDEPVEPGGGARLRLVIGPALVGGQMLVVVPADR